MRRRRPDNQKGSGVFPFHAHGNTPLCVKTAAAGVLCAAAAAAAVEIKVEFYGPRTVHVTKTPEGAVHPESFAVVAPPPVTTPAGQSLVKVERGEAHGDPAVVDFEENDRR